MSIRILRHVRRDALLKVTQKVAVNSVSNPVCCLSTHSPLALLLLLLPQHMQVSSGACLFFLSQLFVRAPSEMFSLWKKI